MGIQKTVTGLFFNRVDLQKLIGLPATIGRFLQTLNKPRDYAYGGNDKHTMEYKINIIRLLIAEAQAHFLNKPCFTVFEAAATPYAVNTCALVPAPSCTHEGIKKGSLQPPAFISIFKRTNGCLLHAADALVRPLGNRSGFCSAYSNSFCKTIQAD